MHLFENAGLRFKVPLQAEFAKKIILFSCNHNKHVVLNGLEPY